MSNEDKTTVKVRAYADNAKNVAPQSNLTEEQNNALELVKKTAQLEEEKKKSLEHLKAIEQLREILKQEQAKTAEMAKKITMLEDQAKEHSTLEAKARKSIELEVRVKELTETLGKISTIAATGKAG